MNVTGKIIVTTHTPTPTANVATENRRPRERDAA